MLTFVLWPVFTQRHGSSARQATCQSNLKELALAFSMYVGEYDGMLPSSDVCGTSDATFRGVLRGTLPKAKPARTIFHLFYTARITTNEGAFTCPSDTEPGPSYVLKKAINDAWIDPSVKARAETDYKWPAEQLSFYERRSFHWGDKNGDLSVPHNGNRTDARVNCAFVDGHVVSRQMTEFEPDYYNWNMTTDQAVKQPQINPRLYADRLK